MVDLPAMRRAGLLVCLLAAVAATGCPRRRAPPPPRDPNVQLHLEPGLSTPRVDLRRDPDAGTQRIQIGGAVVNLPTREPELPPTEP